MRNQGNEDTTSPIRGFCISFPLLFLDGGELAEAGKHEELMGVGGEYAELYELPSAAYWRPAGPRSGP